MIQVLRSIKRRFNGSTTLQRPYHFQGGNSPKSAKRALLSYLVTPLIEQTKGVPTSKFSNNGAARAWGRVLTNLGYELDVVEWDDVNFIPKDKYDLIILHGGKNYKNLLGALNTNGRAVYYSTGSYWRYHNKQELQRFAEFEARTGLRLLPDRLITDDEEGANKAADAIISLGNERAASTYSRFSNVFNLEGASYLDTTGNIVRGEHSSRNFLFMAGPGNIHKGLDIAIEAFRELPDYHLHIMMSLDDGFEEYYGADLKRSNIHHYGYVEQRSPEYYSIVKKCGYIMLLSCSEGSPGSVIEGMTQGLIPIVSRDSHIDLPDNGLMINDVTVQNVIEIVREAGKLKPEEIMLGSERVLDYVQGHFGIERFDSELTVILKKIIEPGV